jgi:hypothetical protein
MIKNKVYFSKRIPKIIINQSFNKIKQEIKNNLLLYHNWRKNNNLMGKNYNLMIKNRLNLKVFLADNN